MISHAPSPSVDRSPWKAVVLPSEHGGWGLTLEPVVLGLLVAASWAGLAIGVAALLAFLARTPLKLVLVDRHRDRWLERTSLALRVACAQSVSMAVLAAGAVWLAGWAWLAPIAVAVPLVGVELWFDMHSRGRRLVPELCGAVGIGSVAAAIVIAGGRGWPLGVGCWLVLAGRAVGAIPFVRVQIKRLRAGTGPVWQSDLAQVVAVCVGFGAVWAERSLIAGLMGLTALAALQSWWVRRPPTPAKVLGIRQMALGMGLVAVTALGVVVA